MLQYLRHNTNNPIKAFDASGSKLNKAETIVSVNNPIKSKRKYSRTYFSLPLKTLLSILNLFEFVTKLTLINAPIRTPAAMMLSIPTITPKAKGALKNSNTS